MKAKKEPTPIWVGKYGILHFDGESKNPFESLLVWIMAYQGFLIVPAYGSHGKSSRMVWRLSPLVLWNHCQKEPVHFGDLVHGVLSLTCCSISTKRG